MKNLFDTSFDFSDFFMVPSGSLGGGNSSAAPVLGAPIDVPAEELEAEATVTASGTGAPGSVVAVGSSAGLTINLLFDNAAMAAPQSFRDGITQAMQMICAAVTDKITLNLSIDYSGTGGGAFGGPSGGNYVTYSTVRADLVNNASAGDTSFNALPTGSTIAGQSQVAVWYSQEKLWGLISPTGNEVDGSATFATDINPNLLAGVALHELTHAMGRVPYAGSNGQSDVFDFYRFTSPGNILVNGNNTAPAAYFSLDGGTTKIADYGKTSDPSDFLNSGVQGSTDPFNEFYSSSTQQQLTAIDLKQLDALGFHLATSTPTVIEAVGATALVQVGSNYFLNPTAGGTGPELKYEGAAVTVREFGAYVPLGAELVSGGYEVAWFDPIHNVFSIWSTDSDSNYTGNFYLPGSGTTAAFESFEPGFQQDLNGDGVIGIPSSTTKVIEAVGATALVQVGSNYFLNPTAGGTGPELKYEGAAVTVGEFGAYVPLGAEPVSGGYEVAWLDPSRNLYSVWSTDSSGNYTGNLYQPGPGNSPVLETLEQSFSQDLNGDGAIGIPADTKVIEAVGTTELVKVGSNYFLDPAVGGFSVELNYQGAPVTAGEFGAFVPLGSEPAPGGGYEVTWFDSSRNIYSVWSTDSSGNYTGNLYQPGTGNSVVLESLESTFHQDLNADGHIGLPTGTTLVEGAGSTALVQVGNNFFLDPIAGGTGPELKYQSAPVTAGEFGNYVLMGVEAASNGYEVAWFDLSRHVYSVWSTDTNGNYNGNFFMPGSGESPVLESLEQSFHQDLNADGTIGIPTNTTVIEAAGATELVKGGSNFFLDAAVGGISFELKYQGAPVTEGQFGTYVPIGVENVSGGYEVAWKNASTGQYSVWSTDSNGNYNGNFYMPGPGNSATLEALEPSFQQDLNGDGITGIPAHASSSAQSSIQAQAAQSTFAGDTLLFRSDLGGGANSSASLAPTASQNVIPVNLANTDSSVAHVGIADSHDLSVTHDSSQVHLFDSLHGFIIH